MIGRWDGETVAIIASGPSLTQSDVDYLRGKCRVITVNTSFKIAPWADVHYSNDHDWFATYRDELKETSGEQWTGHHTYHHAGLNRMPFDQTITGISFVPGVLSWGGNSGFAAINLAVQFGAVKILLLGFDHGWDGDKCHHHGKHPSHLQHKKPGFHRWTIHHEKAAKQLPAAGITIINCTRQTGLTCYPMMPIQQALK
jgi:hypothetical protein